MRDAIYDVLLAPFWSIVLTVVAGVTFIGLSIAASGLLVGLEVPGVLPFWAVVNPLAWLAWIIALIALGFGLASTAANNWDGLVEEWSRAARQRRWLVVRMTIGPAPVLLSSVIFAGLSGFYGGEAGVRWVPDLAGTVRGIAVLSIQAYGIVLASVLLAQAYLRDQDLTRETVEVFS